MQMRSTLAKFIPGMALAAAIALAVAGCGGNDDQNGPAAPDPESGTPAPASSEAVPAGIEAAARMLLSEELEVDEGDFNLHSSEEAEWSDSSLGCPEEGMAYAQVITPGFKLVFGRAGTSYSVHTNSDGSHMVVCGDGE